MEEYFRNDSQDSINIAPRWINIASTELQDGRFQMTVVQDMLPERTCVISIVRFCLLSFSSSGKQKEKGQKEEKETEKEKETEQEKEKEQEQEKETEKENKEEKEREKENKEEKVKGREGKREKEKGRREREREKMRKR